MNFPDVEMPFSYLQVFKDKKHLLRDQIKKIKKLNL